MKAKELYELVISNANQIDNDFLNNELLPQINKAIDKEEKRRKPRGAYSSVAVKRFLGEGILQKAHVNKLYGNKVYGFCDRYKLAWSNHDYGLGSYGVGEALYWVGLTKVEYVQKTSIPITKEMKTELNSILKTHKISKNYELYSIKIWGINIQVNPEHLKACIDFTGAEEMVVDIKGFYKPIIFYGPGGNNALLLPVSLLWMED